MLTRLLRGTEWGEISSYLSPSFFSVIPPLQTALRLKDLTSGYLSGNGFSTMAHQLQSHLNDAGLPIEIELAKAVAATDPEQTNSDSGQVDQQEKSSRGDLLLQLYFTQILHLPSCLVDYRRSRFAPRLQSGKLIWHPSPLMVTWESQFLAAVRRLYKGFYEYDDQEFTASLTALGLESARAELMEHFGSREEKVTFNLAAFRASFHQIFLAAKKGKQRISSEFLPFGVGLACLYEHLEELGGTYDVRAAYIAATGHVSHRKGVEV